MSHSFRPVNKEDMKEMRFIAETDSRIPLEYDSTYTFSEASIDSRLKFYQQISQDDFFEVVSQSSTIVAFHIVIKTPYPPNLHMANVITLWVHPDSRGQNLAAQLKSRAESWAKKSGLIFIQTNVHKNNKRMLEMNEKNGYEVAYVNMRKTL